MRAARVAGLAGLAGLLYAIVVNVGMPLVKQVHLATAIGAEELFAAQTAWGDALIATAKTYEEEGYEAAKELASKYIDQAYGYKRYGAVLFKPTMAGGEQTFRVDSEGALSYFVGGNEDYPDDHGFAIKGWRHVDIVNRAVFRSGRTAVTQGWVVCTDKEGKITKVDKSWVFYKGWDGKLRIVMHHSSLPYAG